MSRWPGQPAGGRSGRLRPRLPRRRRLPPVAVEEQAVGQVLDKAEPVKEQLVAAGQEVGEHLKESATEAVEQVKQAAQDSGSEVAETAKDAAQTSTSAAKDAADTVRVEATPCIHGDPSQHGADRSDPPPESDDEGVRLSRGAEPAESPVRRGSAIVLVVTRPGECDVIGLWSRFHGRFGGAVSCSGEEVSWASSMTKASRCRNSPLTAR